VPRALLYFVLLIRNFLNYEAQLSILCKLHIVLLFVLSLGAVALFASDIPTPWTAPHFTIDPKALYEQASEAAASEGTNVAVLDDDEGCSLDASGRGLYTEYTVYKVLTQQGAEGWSSISVTWELWHQERLAVRIRVIAPDYVVHDLDLKTLADAPAQDEQSNIYSDRRVIRGPLPAVAPGHSSQGQTADRVLIHVDTELGAKDLLSSRMAYVSVSRGRYDAQIYTNNAPTLGQELSRDVSHSPAIPQEPGAHKMEPQTTHTNQISQGFSLGL
jgi:hypothetical protein